MSVMGSTPTPESPARDSRPADSGSTVLANHGRVGFRSWAGERLRRDLSNWRLFLVRLVSSGLAVVITVAVLPGLWFTSWQTGKFLLIAVVFGLLNATVKPLLQFFSLRYLVATYGVVVVLINAVLLLLLSWVLDDTLQASGLLALLVGGLVVGVVGLALDTMAGTTPPIVDRPHGGKPDDEESPSHPAPQGRPWSAPTDGKRWYERDPDPNNPRETAHGPGDVSETAQAVTFHGAADTISPDVRAEQSEATTA